MHNLYPANDNVSFTHHATASLQARILSAAFGRNQYGRASENSNRRKSLTALAVALNVRDAPAQKNNRQMIRPTTINTTDKTRIRCNVIHGDGGGAGGDGRGDGAGDGGCLSSVAMLILANSFLVVQRSINDCLWPVRKKCPLDT